MMRLVETTLALIGLSATVTVVFFRVGYMTICPPCGNVLAVFTKECRK